VTWIKSTDEYGMECVKSTDDNGMECTKSEKRIIDEFKNYMKRQESMCMCKKAQEFAEVFYRNNTDENLINLFNCSIGCKNQFMVGEKYCRLVACKIADNIGKDFYCWGMGRGKALYLKNK